MEHSTHRQTQLGRDPSNALANVQAQTSYLRAIKPRNSRSDPAGGGGVCNA